MRHATVIINEHDVIIIPLKILLYAVCYITRKPKKFLIHREHKILFVILYIRRIKFVILNSLINTYKA